MSGENLKAAITSPLGRAKQTANILAEQLGTQELHESDAFKERGEGAFEGLTRAQQMRDFSTCFEGGTGTLIPDHIPGGETTADFLSRVSAGLMEVRELPWDKILVVTHAGVLQAMTSVIHGRDFNEVARTEQPGFCDLVRFEMVE